MPVKIFRSYGFHNLIGHPLMQICFWLKLSRLGNKIHDITIPMDK